MQLSESELTIALTGVAKATLAAQNKDIRKGKVDVEDVWRDLGGYGRYQVLDSLGGQVLPVLASLPDVPRVHGERPSYGMSQIKAAVEEHVGDEGGRLRRKATVLARVALVQAALAQLPPYVDPDADPDVAQAPE
ncbi:MAG: hypothetical protein J7518_10285 [Nocardioidaceae bacterium]|nr:hypothetical protein [Nocardioidaceae bacterium]